MFPFFYLKIAKDSGCGLCNQIYALTGCIDYAIHSNNYRVIIVDSFLKEIHKKQYLPIENVFDLNYIQFFLLEKYNILVFDKNNLKINIENIVYEDFLSKKQITDLNWDNYFFNNILYIPKELTISQLSNSQQEITNGRLVAYITMNDFPVTFITRVINGCLERDIFINTNTDIIPDEYYIPSPQLYLGQSSNPLQFIDILQNIHFHKQFCDSNEMMIKNIAHDFSLSSFLEDEKRLQFYSKINIVHLRLEEDAITSFSKQNKTNSFDFQKKVEERYIELIQKYIHPTDELTIVLSSHYNNGVIDFLSQKKYRFVCTPKIYSYREINAIQDLLFHRFCNHIFIGIYESSFSYTLMLKMFKREIYNNTRSILFKMNDIYAAEKIYTKNSFLEEICQFT
jgi:hypothetical protein